MSKSVLRQFSETFTTYQEKFGLNGYQIYFQTAPIGDSYANIFINQDGMVATVTLNNAVSKEDKSHQDIHKNAKHEALHLLVGRFSDYAQSRYVTRADITEAEEELVRRLDTLIPDIKV